MHLRICPKTPVFQSNQAMNEYHISLNSQFIVALDGIICLFFLVQFCDNSLLVLKMRFQPYSFASTKVKGFLSDRKILMSLFYQCSFIYKNVPQFFEIFIFSQSQDIWGNVHYVPESTSDKSFLSPEQNKLKEI